MNKFEFKIIKKDKKSSARLGIIRTPNGTVRTPAFIAVATNASLKGSVSPDDARLAGAQALLGNTYHLYVRGQVNAVKKGGGLAKFMGWKGPTYTDSGGYQVFSLGDRLKDGVGKFQNYDSIKSVRRNPKKPLLKISERGVEFKSHIDGSLIKITPESSMTIQEKIGADMIFAFDQPTSPSATIDYSREAMERTHRWAKRCLNKHSGETAQGTAQALFGIVQGGPYRELREESARFIASLDFPGYGIGGSYHRINNSDRFNELDWVIPHLHEGKPKHFLGIGGIEDMIVAVFQGCDTFDCVIPTREARHGRLYDLVSDKRMHDYFVWQYNKVQGKPAGRKPPAFYRIVNITNKKHRLSLTPLGDAHENRYTFGYIHHLFRVNEPLGHRLSTVHNLGFYFHLMEQLRLFIKKQT